MSFTFPSNTARIAARRALQSYPLETLELPKVQLEILNVKVTLKPGGRAILREGSEVVRKNGVGVSGRDMAGLTMDCHVSHRSLYMYLVHSTAEPDALNYARESCVVNFIPCCKSPVESVSATPNVLSGPRPINN